MIRKYTRLDARPETVRAIFRDVERWPSWMPGIESVELRLIGLLGPDQDLRLSLSNLGVSVVMVEQRETGVSTFVPVILRRPKGTRTRFPAEICVNKASGTL